MGGEGSCSDPLNSTQGWESHGPSPIRVERLDTDCKSASPLRNDRPLDGGCEQSAGGCVCV